MQFSGIQSKAFDRNQIRWECILDSFFAINQKEMPLGSKIHSKFQRKLVGFPHAMAALGPNKAFDLWKANYSSISRM